MRVLVTGATGYVGSRLVPRLVEDGHDVVAATRGGSIDDFAWGDDVDVAAFDVEDESTIRSATKGVDAVIYLVHSMDSGEDFVAKDKKAAEQMADAAYANGVGRIVYLSGLVPDGELSDHLRSRLQVEEVFLASPVPAVVLRAAMVIGSGSDSFELMSRMSRRVPVTPIPLWMRSTLQPIAVVDVVELIAAALRGRPRNRHYDVGGPDRLTYPELLATFARVAGLHRLQFPVLWAPQQLVGTIVSWVAQMPRPEVVALVESLSHEMVCRDDDATRELLEPGYEYQSVEESLRRSLKPDDDATTRRGDPQVSAPSDG